MTFVVINKGANVFVALHEVDLGQTIWVNPFQIQTLSPFEKNTKVTLAGGRVLLVAGSISQTLELLNKHYKANPR